MNRVVVTGIGVISSAGNTLDELWSKVSKGETTVDYIRAFDTSNFKCNLAAEVKDFDAEKYGISQKEQRRFDRFCQFAVASASEAYKMSGIDIDSIDATRCGVIFGSGIGGLSTFETEHEKYMAKGPGRVSPLFIPMLITNIACGNISIRLGFKGTCLCPVTACATSTNAIGEAYRNIKHGYSDIILAGGSEAAVTPLAIAGFSNMTALTHGTTPETGSLPFDIRRSGFVMGEGGGALVLENYEHAIKRDAKIYGEIIGYGSTADSYHITSPDPSGIGAANAMKLAMQEGNILPCNVDYINAHGTGTELNDKTETKAIKMAMGESAYTVAISSTKGVTGHVLGATGAIEAIISLLAMQNSIVPPTANLREPDPECDLNYTPLLPVKREINCVLSNSFGFGGTNATILLKKYI